MNALRAVVVSLLLAVAVLGVAEGCLRLVGFEREAAPVVFRFGYPDAKEITGIFQADSRLFWRFRPGTVFDAEAPVPINRRGYRGTEPAIPRPERLLRVAVMGDSVAFGSARAWPEILEESLRGQPAWDHVEVLNFGVPGYTVVQGARQFEDDVAPLGPDVVILAYGWNDHWIARGGLPDAARDPEVLETRRIALALGSLRLTQALGLLLGRAAPVDRPDGSSVRRVPMPTFLDHMERLIRSARESGALPMVVGLPSALTEETVPAYLVDQGFTPAPGDAVSDHARYVELARAAAERTGAPFVETGEPFAPAGAPDPTRFTRDRIHLSEKGHILMAGLVRDVLIRALAGTESGR